MAPKFYYDHTTDSSTQLALDISIINYLSKVLYNNDITRTLYASNAFCFRERLDQQRKTANRAGAGPALNTLDFPFTNFWQLNEGAPTERGWRNALMVKQGFWVDELQTNLQIAPVDYSYQSTAFFKHERDLDKAYDLLSWETQYPITFTDLSLTWRSADNTQDLTFPLPSVVTFDLQYNPTYNEQEWLEKERVLSMTLDFRVQTFRMKAMDPNSGNFWVPTQVLFDFASLLNIADPTTQSYDKLTTLVIDAISGTTHP